jgi:hypothetical protein
MNRLTLIAASLVLLIGLAGPQASQAQVDLRLGPRIGLDFGDVEEPFIGADARIDTPALPVTINPTFDLYFVDPGSFFSISGNALYMFGFNNQVFDPYAGAGLGIYRSSVNDNSNTDLGLNFLFGAEFDVGGVSPFAEAQVTPIFNEASPTIFSLKGGVLFNL